MQLNVIRFHANMTVSILNGGMWAILYGDMLAFILKMVGDGFTSRARARVCVCYCYCCFVCGEIEWSSIIGMTALRSFQFGLDTSLVLSNM